MCINAALFTSSIEIEAMERLKVFWFVTAAAILLCNKWGVEGLEAEEIFSGNETNVSFLESLSYLESVYGVADASPPANALMVPLTLIQGAAAKGAGK